MNHFESVHIEGIMMVMMVRIYIVVMEWTNSRLQRAYVSHDRNFKR